MICCLWQAMLFFCLLGLCLMTSVVNSHCVLRHGLLLPPTNELCLSSITLLLFLAIVFSSHFLFYFPCWRTARSVLSRALVHRVLFGGDLEDV